MWLYGSIYLCVYTYLNIYFQVIFAGHLSVAYFSSFHILYNSIDFDFVVLYSTCIQEFSMTAPFGINHALKSIIMDFLQIYT